MKIINYCITYIDHNRTTKTDEQKEELIILRLGAIKRYCELLINCKFNHIDNCTHEISSLKIWAITKNNSIDITGKVNKFLA